MNSLPVKGNVVASGPGGRVAMSPAARVVGAQLLAEAAYQELTGVLAGCGVDHLVLKGPHLGATVYDDPSQRAYCDLDVLVRAGQFNEAVTALVAAGFQRKTPMARRSATRAFAYERTVVSPQGWTIEVHRALAPHGQYRVDHEALFARSEAFRFGQVPARGLAPEDLLLHLVVHAAKTQFSIVELKHVQDVALLVTRRPVQWDMFERLAREAGCTSAAWVWLSAAAKIFGAPIPEEVLQRIQPSVPRRWWLGLWVTQEQFPLLRQRWLPKSLRRLLLAPALIDRFRQGAASGLRFAMVRFRDFIGRLGE